MRSGQARAPAGRQGDRVAIVRGLPRVDHGTSRGTPPPIPHTRDPRRAPPAWPVAWAPAERAVAGLRVKPAAECAWRSQPRSKPSLGRHIPRSHPLASHGGTNLKGFPHIRRSPRRTARRAGRGLRGPPSDPCCLRAASAAGRQSASGTGEHTGACGPRAQRPIEHPPEPRRRRHPGQLRGKASARPARRRSGTGPRAAPRAPAARRAGTESHRSELGAPLGEKQKPDPCFFPSISLCSIVV